MDFLEADAPMTAKCIIRDVARRLGMSELNADMLVIKCVAEIRAEGYKITADK